MNINELRAFVPCKDFNESKSFYLALGFKIEDASSELSICTKDKCTFFLQNFYNEELANNLMFQLIVEDIGKAFKNITEITHIKIEHSPITQEHWGKVIYLWGPSGELWHITELSS